MTIERTPCIAIVLDDDLVQDIVIQDWPRGGLLPDVVVVNHHLSHDSDDPRTLTIGDDQVQVRCQTEPVTVFELAPASTLEPRQVFDEVVRIERADRIEMLQRMTDELQGAISGLAHQIAENRAAPSGEHYLQLQARLENWLPLVRKQLSRL